MGFPRIVYNSKTIDFSIPVERCAPDPLRNYLSNMSASGIEERINIRMNEVVEVRIAGMNLGNATDETLRRNILQWFTWAQNGGAWTFAKDSAKAATTTTTGSEAAGQTVIGLTSTTGFAAGDTCVIRSKTHSEVIKILTVDSSVQVTLVESLNFDYATGSRFRHEFFWSGLLAGGRNPVQRDRTQWRFEMQFREDVNSL